MGNGTHKMGNGTHKMGNGTNKMGNMAEKFVSVGKQVLIDNGFQKRKMIEKKVQKIRINFTFCRKCCFVDLKREFTLSFIFIKNLMLMLIFQ